MKTVWKFPVMNQFGVPALSVPMPVGAVVVSVAWQSDGLYVWAVVDPADDVEGRVFLIAGTGHPLIVDATYIGTAHGCGPERSLVFHVFEATQ